MKARILVLSHSYIMKSYRQKFTLIGQLTDQLPEFQIRIITPNHWFENFQQLTFEPTIETSCQEIALPIIFSGYSSRFVYQKGLTPHFRDFQPDIIHLEEEAWSLNALQTLFLQRRFCPQSKLVFRTSLSVDVEQRFGVVPKWIEKQVFKKTDMAFPLSQNAVQILARRGYTGPTLVFPNGVDLSLFQPLPDMPVTDQQSVENLKHSLGLIDHFVIGYIGRLLHMKGIDILFQAVKLMADNNLNQFKVLLLGRGEYKLELEQLAKVLGIESHLIWVDAVPPEEVPKYINCMDTLVLPSRTRPDWVEFFGRVLIEAMACQIPVIGSDSGEIARVIGSAGLIFPEDETNILAQHLKLLYQNQSFRRKLALQGFQRVRKFAWQTIAQNTLNAYINLLSTSNRSIFHTNSQT